MMTPTELAPAPGRAAIILILCMALTPSWQAAAQATRRAVPVEDGAPGVPRAVPFQPGPAPRATIVTDPAPAPAPATPKTADPNKPTGPDEDLFDYASLLYDRKEYALAADSFGQYLQRHPGGRHVPMCLFRLGECFVNQNQVADAEKYFIEVVNRYPASDGAPSAAYRLGAIRFNDKKFDESAKYFAFSEAKSSFAEVKLAAAYNKSRAWQMLGDRKKMIAALQAVAAVKKDNPYLESALISLATALLAEDKKKEALKLFYDLLAASQDKLIIADATVKAGVIEAETGKPDEALKHFDEALKMLETTPENRGVALVGSVQALFAKGDYNAVIDTYNRNASVLPPGELRPKMLLLVGNAHRLRKTYSRAVEMYLIIEQHHADTDQAFEAGYWKLYCFYLLGDRDLPEFSRAFLARYARTKGDHEFVTLAQLILADAYFNKQQYKEAASAFVDVRTSKLPEKLRPDCLFNRGWAEAESGLHQDAVTSLTRFITDYAKHEFIPKALARRGLSFREVRDLPKAKDDFTRVTKEFPTSEAAELAFLQLGFIHMELQQTKEMIASFESLVTKFPASPAAAQAWYGIGRGCLELKQFDKAASALRKSIALDSKTYLDKASPLIILVFYAKQDADELARSIDDYRDANPKASTPPNVLGWLGITLFNKNDFARSARFLTYASADEASPSPVIWDHLGRAWLELKKYDEANAATDKLLADPPDIGTKARGLLTKSRALLGMGKFADADQTAKEALTIVKDGKLQAQLLIQTGDIYFEEGEQIGKSGDPAGAQQKWEAAAGKYVVPSQIFVDPQITPEALFKAARALERAGQADKAADFRKQLKDRYPEYRPAPSP